MADIRISHLPVGGRQRGGDIVPATRAGSDFKTALPAPLEPSYQGAYSGATAYALGQYVRDASSPPRFYISRTDNNVGNGLSSTAHWAQLAPLPAPAGLAAGGVLNSVQIFNQNVEQVGLNTTVLLDPAVEIPAAKVWYISTGADRASPVNSRNWANARTWGIVDTDDIRGLAAWTSGQPDATNSLALKLPGDSTAFVRLCRNAQNQLRIRARPGAYPFRIRQSA